MLRPSKYNIQNIFSIIFSLEDFKIMTKNLSKNNIVIDIVVATLKILLKIRLKIFTDNCTP